MTAVISFCVLCLLLVSGKAVRTAVPFLRKLYLPSSIIGGAIGLALLTTCDACIPPAWHAGWQALPGFLINIVFAAMFIGQRFRKTGRLGRAVAEQLCFGQVVAWGMYVVTVWVNITHMVIQVFMTQWFVWLKTSICVKFWLMDMVTMVVLTVTELLLCVTQKQN